MTAASRLAAARGRLRAVDERPFFTPRTLAERLSISERTHSERNACRIAGTKRPRTVSPAGGMADTIGA
jgi:hypothetical protein